MTTPPWTADLTGIVQRRSQRVVSSTGRISWAALLPGLLLQVLGWAMAVAMGRLLPATHFADAALAIALIGSSGVVAIARAVVASGVPVSPPVAWGEVRRQRRHRSFRIGLVIGGLLALAAPALAGWLGTASTWPFLAPAVAMPWLVAGEVGRETTDEAVAVSRLAGFHAGILLRFGVPAVLVACLIALAGGYGPPVLAGLYAYALVAPAKEWRRIGIGRLMSRARPWAAATLFTASGAALVYGDVVAVRAVSSPVEAGRYGAAALMGGLVIAAAVPAGLVSYWRSARCGGSTPEPGSILALVPVPCLLGVYLARVPSGAGEVVRATLGPEFLSVAGLVGPVTMAAGLIVLGAMSLGRGMATKASQGVCLLAGAAVLALVAATVPETVEGMATARLLVATAFAGGASLWERTARSRK